MYPKTRVLKNGKTIKIISSGEHRQSISEKDAEMDRRAKEAVHAAIEKAKICGKPVAKYDIKLKKAYLEYANGEKKYVE